jgi:hypothetical protein
MKVVNYHLKKFASPGSVEVRDSVAESRYWGANGNAIGTVENLAGGTII